MQRRKSQSGVRANNLHKVHCPLFCEDTSLKSAYYPSPPFLGNSLLCIVFFVTVLSVSLHNIKIFKPHPFFQKQIPNSS